MGVSPFAPAVERIGPTAGGTLGYARRHINTRRRREPSLLIRFSAGGGYGLLFPVAQGLSVESDAANFYLHLADVGGARIVTAGAQAVFLLKIDTDVDGDLLGQLDRREPPPKSAGTTLRP
jgi:hypothetical protein